MLNLCFCMRYRFQKYCDGTCYTELAFFHSEGYAGHVVHADVSGALNVDALLLVLRWDKYRFHKNHDGTCYDELVFLHLVGYAGHIVHCVASGT
jgi:hypothetical protein